MENDVLGKPPVRLQLQDGEARFTKGAFAHVAKNLAETPFRNVTVELLKRGDYALPCDWTSGPGRCDLQVGDCVVQSHYSDHTNAVCALSTQVLTGKSFEIRRTKIPPGLSGAKHTHAGPHLAIALTDLDLRSVDADGKSKEIHQHAGDIAWIPGGLTHTLSNLGTKPASLVTIEFKQ